MPPGIPSCPVRWIWVWVWSLLAAGTLLAADAELEVELKERQLNRLQGDIAELQQEHAASVARRQGLLQTLQDAELAIGASSKRLRQLKVALERRQARLDQLLQQRAQRQTELQRERNALRQQLRSAYLMGRQERLKILLNQRDPSVVSRMMVYYDYINRARTDRMQRIGEVLDRLQQVEAELTTERARLMETEARELSERAALEQERAHRQQIVSELAGVIQSKEARLQGLQRDAQQLQTLLGQLQEALLAAPLADTDDRPFEALRGELSWPAKGRLAAGFGSRKAANLSWDGVLIAAPEGREVQAIHRGRVAFADWLRGFGLLLIIDHGDGYMTLYGYNQSLFKETGEWVEAGEAVASVGSSGGRLDTGVYFGIRYHGRAVNPKKWCKALKGKRIG